MASRPCCETGQVKGSKIMQSTASATCAPSTGLDNYSPGTVARVITGVLGAPGSGKSGAVRPLTALLPGHAILDWDALMGPAAALAGRPIRQNPHTWSAYQDLIRAVLSVLEPRPAVHLGVCTPRELRDWPIGAWILLDCSDEERRRLLVADGRPGDVEAAITDGRHYRVLGLPVIGTTSRTPSQVAAGIAEFVHRAEPAD